MSKEQIKLNKLGKPIKRKNNGDFAKGNQEGKIFGKDQEPKGRPKGSKNLMTIIKEVALAKGSNDGMTNIEFIASTMIDSARDMKKIIDKMDEEDPKKVQLKEKLAYLSSKIMEHLTKYSGDYTQKIQAEVGDLLTDEEKAIMDKFIT